MPRSRKRRHEKSDYYELKKHLKKLVKRRSRSRSRRRHRYDTSSSQELGHDRDRSMSPYGGREGQRSARRGRSPHGRSRTRSRSCIRRRTQSRSREFSRKRRSSNTYGSLYASETEVVTKLSSEVEQTTDRADTGGEASATATCPTINLTAGADKNTIPTGSAAAPDDAGPSLTATDAVAPGSAAPCDRSAANPVVAEEELDSAILEIFGEDPTQTKTYGNDIQKDLAVRLEHVAINGLSKDTRKELKDMKEQLENTKPDNLLFGQNLSETLKTAKAINKSGAELKVPTAPKSVIKKPVPGPSRALNSRGPPARRPAGPPRTKEPAPPPRSQHSKYSRPSQRRHQTFRR